MVIQFANEMLIRQRSSQHRIGEFSFDQAICIKLWIVSPHEHMVIWAELAAKTGDCQDVHRRRVTAKWWAGDNHCWVPVQNTPFFYARRRGWIGKINPINSPKLKRILKGEFV